MQDSNDPLDATMTAQFRAALILESEMPEPSRWHRWRQRMRGSLSRVWSSTAFDDSRVSEYAETLMLDETRRGIMLMATLSLVTQVAAMVLHFRLGADSSFFYTYGLLTALSMHILISSRFVSEIRSLHMLGTILLVITGVAIMAIAHRTGSVNAALLASVVLLFMIMPITPWGLREAATIVGLTYLTFTLSSISVAGRFETEMLWTLQFLMLASATIATLTIMRNAAARRADIEARYQLESARSKLQEISTRDPLTGAWNRRHLEQEFAEIATEARRNGRRLHLAVLDIDAFKELNDTHGHHYGDDVLKRLVSVLSKNLPGTAHVIRLGGDEFAILDINEDFESAVYRCLQHLATDPRLLEMTGRPVEVSVGFAVSSAGETAELDALYRSADDALYRQKAARGRIGANRAAS